MKAKQDSVFEKYAHEYDLITNATERAKSHGREVEALIDRFHPTSILDAGCATGLTTYLFASRGIPAVGLDRSARMIEVARSKYASSKLPMEFLQGDFEKLPPKLNGKFDLVVCLANSISGVSTAAGLMRSLKGFRRCLTPGGSLVIQMLNLASLKEHEVFPIRATRNGEILYLRFSERLGEQHQIHVIRTDLATQPPSYEIFRHAYTSHTKVAMTAALKKAGFGTVTLFGKLDLTEKFSRASRDIVLLAKV